MTVKQLRQTMDDEEFSAWVAFYNAEAIVQNDAQAQASKKQQRQATRRPTGRRRR